MTTVGVKGGNAEAGKGAKRGREEDEEMWRQGERLEEDYVLLYIIYNYANKKNISKHM